MSTPERPGPDQPAEPTPAPTTPDPVAAPTERIDPATTAGPSSSPAATPAAPAPASRREPGTDTGRHAVVRPTPAPPEPAAPRAASTPPTAATSGAAARMASIGQPDPASQDPAATRVAPPAGTAERPAHEPGDDGRTPSAVTEPEAPRKTGFGSHVLGVVLGLLLAPLGAAALLGGQARILAAQVDGWDASTEVLGIVLVSAGLLLLVWVLLLGLWTATVPVTGGLVLTVLGAVYLYAPSLAREQTLAWFDRERWHATLTQVVVTGTSGTLLAAGVLLLVAGLVTAGARRRGVRFGVHSERAAA